MCVTSVFCVISCLLALTTLTMFVAVMPCVLRKRPLLTSIQIMVFGICAETLADPSASSASPRAFRRHQAAAAACRLWVGTGVE